jgi:hypothetical protein
MSSVPNLKTYHVPVCKIMGFSLKTALRIKVCVTIGNNKNHVLELQSTISRYIHYVRYSFLISICKQIIVIINKYVLISLS